LHDIAPIAGGPRRIVLVEDQEDLRGLMREVMERMGHQVVDAGDGLEGVARILAEKPDIAIIDIGLPGIDGFEVARRVRAALGNAVVLVALTGRSKESDRADALAAGFDAHIVKPVGRALIARILETQRLNAS
ncbi:MAG: response regulator, partial [Kofleriaceae bacterium]